MIKGINTAGQSPVNAAYSGFPQQSCGVLNPIFPHSLDHAHASMAAILAHFVNKNRRPSGARIALVFFNGLYIMDKMQDQKNASCKCQYPCGRHGNCGACQEYHRKDGSLTNCGKGGRAAEPKTQR